MRLRVYDGDTLVRDCDIAVGITFLTSRVSLKHYAYTDPHYGEALHLTFPERPDWEGAHVIGGDALTVDDESGTVVRCEFETQERRV